jgi:hypothetical protein
MVNKALDGRVGAASIRIPSHNSRTEASDPALSRILDRFGQQRYASYSSHLVIPKRKLEDHMKLLTAELRASLPPLYAQEKNTDPIVNAKCFLWGIRGGVGLLRVVEPC